MISAVESIEVNETYRSDDTEITAGVLHYFSRAMPEHAATFRSMFSQFTLKVRHTKKLEFEEGDAVDVSPSVIFGTIQIPPIMLTLLWLTAQGAWKVMRAYGSVIIAARQSKTRQFDGSEVENAAATFADSTEGLAAIQCAIDTAQGKAVTLPLWFPQIGQGQGIEQQAILELWLFAAVWMLLHEFHHVRYQNEGAVFETIIEEEIACDAGASSALLDDLERYAQSSHEPAAKVRGKRAMGILVGLFCVAVLSPQSQSETHPNPGTRISLLLDAIGDQPAGMFWEFALGLLFVLRADRVSISFPWPATWREVARILAVQPEWV